MTESIIVLLQEHFPQVPCSLLPNISPDCLLIDKSILVEACALLRSHPNFYFDHLACITGIDSSADTMEVVYSLYSITNNMHLQLKVILNRAEPIVPSLCMLWAGANWHEREAYDLLGIVFEGHPDLRRILLPGDWHGHPLQKDYKAQDYYHGIKVAFS